MFQFLGSILDCLLMVTFGAIAFALPYQLVSKRGLAIQVEKRVRFVKVAGAVLVFCGIGLLVFKLVA